MMMTKFKKNDPEKTMKRVMRVAKKLLSPHLQSIGQREWQFLFQDVHSVCNAHSRHAQSKDSLYQRLETLLQSHVRGLSEKYSGYEGLELLKHYSEDFKNFAQGAHDLNLPCRPLNKELEKASAIQLECNAEPKFEVNDLAMKIWREVMFDRLVDKLVPEVVAQIHLAREGNDINDKMVAGILVSMLDMCSYLDEPATVYIDCFENSLLKSTEEYYNKQASEYIESHSISEYIAWAHDIAGKETYRSSLVLPQFSQDKLMRKCLAALTASRKDQLQVAAKDFISEQRVTELQQLYELLKKAKQLSILTTKFEEAIASHGKDALTSLKTAENLNAQSFFDKMRALHEQYSQLYQKAFEADTEFAACLDRAFSKIVNIEKKKAPEFLAKVCDTSLKKSSKAPSVDELDRILDYVVTLFKYLQDKDIFQNFYKKYLARRLIHSSSSSEEAEQGMIARLKALCGFDFTSRLQRMFTDVPLSTDLAAQFAELHSGDLRFNFHVLVAQQGAWPLPVPQDSASVAASFPPTLASCLQKFSNFYKTKFSGRKLMWLHHLDTVDLKATFGKKRLEFHATAYQACVLLLFNEHRTLSLHEIAHHAHMQEDFAVKMVQSLVHCKVVKKNDDGNYCVNDKFKSKRHRVKITAAIVKDAAPAEKAQTYQLIDEDRKVFLQAVTVRCMKMRKSMRYNALAQEVLQMSQARFTPSFPQIKKCVEELIDKEYMRRDENDRALLFYVA